MITFQLRSPPAISILSFKLTTIHFSSPWQGNCTEAGRPVLRDEPNREVRSKGLWPACCPALVHSTNRAPAPAPVLPDADSRPDPTESAIHGWGPSVSTRWERAATFLSARGVVRASCEGGKKDGTKHPRSTGKAAGVTRRPSLPQLVPRKRNFNWQRKEKEYLSSSMMASGCRRP